MNARVNRTIVIAAAFTMVAGVIVDSASAQLFGRLRRNANCCCVPVTPCCSTQHYHGGTAYGMYQPGYATSYSGVYGRNPNYSGGYVSSSSWGTGSLMVNHNGCGSANVVRQGYSSQGHNQGQTSSGATFDAPGSSSTQQNSSQNSAFGNQGSTQTSSQNSFGTNQDSQLNSDRTQQNRDVDGNLQLNQDGTIRSNNTIDGNNTIRGNSDLNIDGSLRGNTDLNNNDGANRSDSDLNLDGSIRSNSSGTIEKSNGGELPDDSQNQQNQK